MSDSRPNFDAGIDHPIGGRLLPVVTQDARSDRVLMLAWMNAEAYLATLTERRAVYFSRSRGELWRKGETSGHVQPLVEIRIDCDADAILLRVDQSGAACHEGYPSCFFRSHNEQTQRYEIRDQKLNEPIERPRSP